MAKISTVFLFIAETSSYRILFSLSVLEPISRGGAGFGNAPSPGNDDNGNSGILPTHLELCEEFCDGGGTGMDIPCSEGTLVGDVRKELCLVPFEDFPVREVDRCVSSVTVTVPRVRRPNPNFPSTAPPALPADAPTDVAAVAGIACRDDRCVVRGAWRLKAGESSGMQP